MAGPVFESEPFFLDFLYESFDFFDYPCDLFNQSNQSLDSSKATINPIVYPSVPVKIEEEEMEQTVDPVSSDSESDDGSVRFDPSEWLVEDGWTSKLRAPRLHEFLRLLLGNLRYLSYASWTNQSKGLFKVHRPDDVARLWSRVKSRQSNRVMDYDTFARGIRSYYANGLMIATRTKYTYRFAMDRLHEIVPRTPVPTAP